MGSWAAVLLMLPLMTISIALGIMVSKPYTLSVLNLCLTSSLDGYEMTAHVE